MASGRRSEPAGPGTRPELLASCGLLLITVTWGTSFALQKIALPAIGPAWFNVLRFAVATGVLVPLFLRSLRRATRRQLGTAAGVGLVLGSAMMLQSAGLTLTSASVGGFISGLPVVMTPILAIVLLGERPGVWTAAGVVLATGGLALISLTDSPAVSRGDLLVLASSAGFALQIVLTGALARSIDPRVLGTMQSVGALAACTSAALLFERPPASVPSQVGAIVLQQGAINLGLVWVLQSWAQRHASATRTALIYTMEPVFALLFAWWWLGESLTPRVATGAAVILVAMLAASLGPHLRRTPAPDRGRIPA